MGQLMFLLSHRLSTAGVGVMALGFVLALLIPAPVRGWVLLESMAVGGPLLASGVFALARRASGR